MYEKMNEKYKVNVCKVAKTVDMVMVTESDGDVELPAGNARLKVPNDPLTNPVRRKTIQMVSPKQNQSSEVIP